MSQKSKGEILTTLLGRLRQTVNSSGTVDPSLTADLARALLEEPHVGALHHALGLAVVHAEAGLGTPAPELAERAAAYFERALACDPDDLMAGLNHVEALLLAGKQQAAIASAER